MALDLDSTVRGSQEVIAAELHGETVLMSIADGAYYGLAQTSHDIWAMLGAPVSVRGICQSLAREYAAPADQIEADVLAFLTHLKDKGLLVLASRDGP